MTLRQKILTLIKDLYPTGRAWSYVTKVSENDGIKGGIIPFVDGEEVDYVDGEGNIYISEEIGQSDSGLVLGARIENRVRVITDILNILDQKYPDNTNFTLQDVINHEVLYGILPNNETSLQNRIDAIKQRLSYPNGILNRLHYTYIQEQLRAMGFDVYVHENRFASGYIKAQVGNVICGVSSFGGYRGQSQQYEARAPELGYTEICANYIDTDIDNEALGNGINPDIISIYAGSFFIGGETYPQMAEVEHARKDEFRHAILSLKPTQMFSYNYINYI